MSKSATENIHLNFYRMHPHAPKKEGKVLQKKWETLTHTEIQCTVFKKKKISLRVLIISSPFFVRMGIPLHQYMPGVFFQSSGMLFLCQQGGYLKQQP